MKVTIEVHPTDAQTFVRYLNEDEGIRETAVRQLLAQNKPTGIEQMTAVVAVFGRISRGFVEALELEGLIDIKGRKVDLKALVEKLRAA